MKPVDTEGVITEDQALFGPLGDFQAGQPGPVLDRRDMALDRSPYTTPTLIDGLAARLARIGTVGRLAWGFVLIDHQSL